MRRLSPLFCSAVLLATSLAEAQPNPSAAQPPELLSDAASARVASDEASAGQEMVEQDAKSERKRNAFLYLVAAGLAAIGTTYTLTRPVERDD